MKTKLFSYTVTISALLLVFACNTQSLEPAVEQSKTVEQGSKSLSDLKALILGAYSILKSRTYYGRDFIILNEVRGINVFSNANSGRFATEATLKYNSNESYIWGVAWRIIASANLIINANITSFKSDEAEAKHIQGQAYALRALVHYDLLKSYGQMNADGTLGIPYITEYGGKDIFPKREEIEAVKTKILADLDKAYELMDDNFFDQTKTTMSRYTAKALESRVCLYFRDWQRANDAAKRVIDSRRYTIVPPNDFVASWGNNSNRNSIFELANTPTENESINSLGNIYRLPVSKSGYGDIQVLDNVLSIFSSTDVRRNIIRDQFGDGKLRNMGKYPNLRGYNDIPLVRYEEIILTYAEALLELNLTSEAVVQLNLIAANRGVTPYTTVTKEDILNERRKELMFEGFIFDDLMRTRKGIPRASFQQGDQYPISYGDSRLALPIPVDEINANPNMKQNKGY